MSDSAEQWRPVIGWPYEVSSRGRVRRSESHGRGVAGHILAPYRRSNGYEQVILHSMGGRRRILVHRLVAMAFLGAPPTRLHEVAHLNGVPWDNRPHNLQWLTHRENEAQKSAHGTLLFGDRVGTAVLSNAAARAIKARLSGPDTNGEIGAEFGVHHSTVSRIRRGRAWRRA